MTSQMGTPPPCPMRGPGRETLVKILQRPDVEEYLPLTLAKNSPDAVVQKENDRWVIRSLIPDEAAARKAADVAIQTGLGFMHESTWPFLHPGPILVEATSKDAFIRAIEKMPWDFGEEDGRGEKPYRKRKKRV